MSFRITNSMMVSSYNRNQNAAQLRMHQFQNQLATQKKVVRLSDDPVNVVKSLNARSRLYDVEQYRKNIEDAKAWLTQTESALMELNELVKRGYELAVQAANDIYTDDDRSAISHEIRQLRDQVASLANSTLGDKFIFGGYNVSSSPFTFSPDETSFLFGADNIVEVDNEGVVMYNFEPDFEFDMIENVVLNDAQQFVRYEINVGQEFDVSISGMDFLGFGTYILPIHVNGEVRETEVSANIYITLNEFYNVINAMSELNLDEGDGAEIFHHNVKPFIDRLQNFQKHALSQVAEVGGRIARMDLMLDRYAKDEINYTQMKSDVEDLDLAEALMWFSMTEAVYRASLGVGGRILPPSFIDFMR
ncbi:MAG: flagellar hook-associated protein FlgL [Oscillospiraceae bacterium]|nr:flagellar hook-associated protein FlgL [Oscillospiraceae bacterium]